MLRTRCCGGSFRPRREPCPQGSDQKPLTKEPRLENGSNIEVIAAVNLPMLIKLVSVRETSSLERAVIQAKEAGRKYICVASQVLDLTPDRVEMPFDQVAIRNHDHSEGSVMVSA